MSRLFNPVKLFVRNVYLDYKEVFIDIKQKAQQRPWKASAYGASILFMINLFRTNENLKSYQDEVVSATNKLIAVADGSRNRKSNQYIRQVCRLNCEGVLREIDLGFSTIIYKSNASSELGLYRATCKYLEPTLEEFFKERIVDLSILGHWLILELKMTDYDINDDEWQQSTSVNRDHQ